MKPLLRWWTMAGTACLLLAMASSCKGCAPRRTLEIVISPEGAGTVTRVPDQDLYRKGDKITLTAAPAAGFFFLGWSEGIAGIENPISLTLQEDMRIVAAFQTLKKASLIVTLSPSAAIAAGAQWRVVGETVWRASGDVATDLSAGACSVEFRPVSGWAPPASRIVALTAGQSTLEEGVYEMVVPDAPVNLSAAPGPDNVALTWDEPTSYTVSGYLVYCAAAGEKAGDAVSLTPDGPIRTLRFSAAPGAAGVPYDYWINAVTATGVQSQASATVRAAWGSVKFKLPEMAVEPGTDVRIPIGVENASGISADTLTLTVYFLDDNDQPADVFDPASISAATTALTRDTQPVITRESAGRYRIAAGMPGAQALVGEGRLYEIGGRIASSLQWGQTFEMHLDETATQLYKGNVPLILDAASLGLLVADNECMRGDLDDSKIIAEADASVALDIAARLTTPTDCHWQAGDLNLDKRINSADATVILRVLQGFYDDPVRDGTPSLRDILRPTSPINVSISAVETYTGADISVPVSLRIPGGITGVEVTVGWPVSEEQLTLTEIEVNADPEMGATKVNTSQAGVARILASHPYGAPITETPQLLTLAWLHFRIGVTPTAQYRPPVTILGVRLYGPYGEPADWYTDIAWEDGAIDVGKAEPILFVTPEQAYVDAAVGETSFWVENMGTGTMSWSAQLLGNPDWVSLYENEDRQGSGTLYVFYDANASGIERSCEIQITAPNATNSPATVTLTQSGVVAGEGETGEGEAPEGEMVEGEMPEGEATITMPPMLPVPAGSFDMGDPWNEGGLDERPVHTVSLAAYRIGQFPITVQEFASALNWARQQGYLENSVGETFTGGAVFAHDQLLAQTFDSSSFSRILYQDGWFTAASLEGFEGTQYFMGSHPVTEVTWYGAVCYCNWLSEYSGLQPCYDTATWTRYEPVRTGFRLPTEAEWERAAAWDAVESRHFRYGASSDALNFTQANFYDESGMVYANPLRLTDMTYTSPVGWYNGVNPARVDIPITLTVNSISPVGCYDMAGNVWEWCHDWYSETYYSESPSENPIGPESGTQRIHRGGNWALPLNSCRTVFRDRNAPNHTSNYLGFRIAAP